MTRTDSDSEGPLQRALSASHTAPIEEVFQLFHEAHEAEREAGRPVGAATVLIEEARIRAGAFESRQIARAHELLDRAEGLLGERPDPAVNAALQHVRGYTFLRAGKQAKAMAVLQQAERAFHGAGDTLGEARVLDTLGVLWEHRGDRERAALLLVRSHTLKQQAGDMEGVAIALGNLGRLALHGGKFQEAAELFHLDLDLARTHGDRRGESIVLTNLAECAVGTCDLPEARAHAQAARSVAQSVNDPVMEGFALLSAADVERAAGLPEESLALVAEGAALFRRAGNTSGLAHARLRCARAHAAAARDDEAARAALGATRAARAARMPDLIIEASLEAHRALRASGRGARARRCLQRAQETALESGLEGLVRRVRSTQRGLAARQAASGAAIRLAVDLAAPAFEAHAGATVELQVEGVLGQGAFALVLLVRDPETDRRYALKRLHYDAERLRSLERRLRREFTAMARVSADAAVVHPVAFGHEDGQPCLLMEYVEPRGGVGSLKDLMEGASGVDSMLAARLGADIARGLAAIHAAGVVHRDLKPANVLLDRESRARLADYGLAFDLNEDEYVQEEGFKGSLGYAAPELFQVGDGAWSAPTPAADLYALGVLLHQLFTGVWPFSSTGSILDVLQSKLAGPPAPRSMQGIPEELRDTVRSTLEPDPARRAADAAHVADTLEDWISTGAGS